MNDDFIYMALPEVPKEFGHSLYKKILAETSSSNRKSYFRLPWRHAVLLAFGLIIFIAWSQLRFRASYVPVGDLWIIEFSKATQEGQSAAPFVPTAMPTPHWEATIYPTAYLFALYFPSWVPEGFRAVHPCAQATCDGPLARWIDEDEQRIELSSTGSRVNPMYPYAPAGMWKEVRVNDDPAILIYGRLALTSPENPRAQRQWDEKLGLQLHWIFEEYTYALDTFGPYLSEQDLIRMAESMEELPPPWFTPVP